MPSWTKEQQEAIDSEGMNIIVSAGAGSGKTAVLSERALRKVLEGVDIDRLLILTFTKAAAYEMMLRIRKKIKQAGLEEQVAKIDKAYITTFDSFSLSIVKKYHDRLNISKNVSIMDGSVSNFIKRNTLDKIMDELYLHPDEKFERLVTDFCLKDDREIREAILKLNDKLDMRYDKEDYLKNYDKNFSIEKIDQDIASYCHLLIEDISKIEERLNTISLMVDGDYFAKLSDSLAGLLGCQHYDEIISHLDVKMPMLPRGSSDEVKAQKEAINKLLLHLKSMCQYESEEEIKETILSTKDYVDCLISIILKLDHELTLYKQAHDTYEFVDISKMAIKIVKENEDIRTSLRDYFNEIMIDEYQDTSDLQEDFIRLIENNNVYMVGDVKQSIYRFRNANPYIFKDKYDRYANNNGGKKIDLVKNFRSRKEVLEDINHIFDFIMDDEVGGAAYSVSHRMVFGNHTYQEEGKTTQNYTTELYQYEYEKNSLYSKDEIEAFIVADDILKKVEGHYQIFDKDECILREATYQDFVILMDRSSKFELYKKIFEYKKIPLTILKDDNIMQQVEIYLVHHILQLLIKTRKKEFDQTFQYALMSIGRSYLFRMSDQELFTILTSHDYFHNPIMDKINELLVDIEACDLATLMEKTITCFEFYQKKITTGNVELGIANLEYITESAENLGKMGFGLEEFSSYLEDTIDSNEEIKIPSSLSSDNSVKIMTIHKSKGLEYPICYYTGLSAKFNVSDLKDKILYDSTYGIITPYFKEGYGDTIYKTLLRQKFYLEEISEKIRLFYVALTRCKEKMILVGNFSEEEMVVDKDGVVSLDRRLQYNSFLEILKSIYEDISSFVTPVSLDEVSLSMDYKKLNSFDFEKSVSVGTEKPLTVKEVEIFPQLEETEVTFSKRMIDLIDKDKAHNLEFGLTVHHLLECLDFRHPNLDRLGLNPFLMNKIKHFLSLPLLEDLEHTNIYQEYEFMYEEEDKVYHGIIDLFLERENRIDVVDYKLKKIQDEAYLKQLRGYQHYLNTVSGKVVNIYLYSIMDEELLLLSSV